MDLDTIIYIVIGIIAIVSSVFKDRKKNKPVLTIPTPEPENIPKDIFAEMFEQIEKKEEITKEKPTIQTKKIENLIENKKINEEINKKEIAEQSPIKQLITKKVKKNKINLKKAIIYQSFLERKY